MAKISTRLVPDQDPAAVFDQLKQYLMEKAPKTVRWELIQMSYGGASISDIHHPATQALAKAFESVWGKPPVYKREGGSIPVVGNMQHILGVESVVLPVLVYLTTISTPQTKNCTCRHGIKELRH